MDIKKLFDYEHALLTQKPEFTADENIKAMSGSDKCEEFMSYNIALNSRGGVAVKFCNKDGKHTAMSYLNPVLAKNLAHDILAYLADQGYNTDLDISEVDHDTHSIH